MLVSSKITCLRTLSTAGCEPFASSAVNIERTPSFLGASATEVKPALRTGIGWPSPMYEPLMVGVAARVGTRMLPRSTLTSIAMSSLNSAPATESELKALMN